MEQGKEKGAKEAKEEVHHTHRGLHIGPVLVPHKLFSVFKWALVIA